MRLHIYTNMFDCIAAADHDDLRRVMSTSGMTEDDWMPDGIDDWEPLHDDELLTVGFEEDALPADLTADNDASKTNRRVGVVDGWAYWVTLTCRQWADRAAALGDDYNARFISSTEW